MADPYAAEFAAPDLACVGRVDDDFVGTVIAQPDWSKGYAAEAVQSVVKWAIEQPRIMRVWALCDSDNESHQRTMPGI